MPIYLGPTLTAALWWPLLRKMIRISKVSRITSLADFIASRYGKSMALGALASCIAVFGIVPYISLQLRAVSISFTLLGHPADLAGKIGIGEPFTFNDTAFYVSIMLAIFAILFGTRHLDVTEHHEGLVAAIAFESVVKLVAFLAVGVFVTYGMFDGLGDIYRRAAAVPELRALFTFGDTNAELAGWGGLLLLSMLAILFLPRQFQMSVVENRDERFLAEASWLFPLYLLIINVFVLPIAFAGRLYFAAGNVDADTFVLTLPLAADREKLALLVFVGGLSAASSMVIVAAVALSTMVSNDLVVPILLRLRWLDLTRGDDLGALLLRIRRVAIAVILALGYLYLRLTGTSVSLVSIGLVSFAAVAQLAPAILGGMYWKGGTRAGALAGLLGGFLVWTYTLPLPSLVASGWLSSSLIDQGPFGAGWLRPYRLFGLDGLDPISHSLFWSLLVNIGAYVGVSLFTRQSVAEQVQARLFVDIFQHSSHSDAAPLWRGTASVENLRTLLQRFLGADRANAEFNAQRAPPRARFFTQPRGRRRAGAASPSRCACGG
ncbi:MAG: histidine kinase, partial [Thermoanaerobaculia bacterium]|nr:histidine kinase [Thermoanaerobaculia bacterium]